jgi:hypothetical protein
MAKAVERPDAGDSNMKPAHRQGAAGVLLGHSERRRPTLHSVMRSGACSGVLSGGGVSDRPTNHGEATLKGRLREHTLKRDWPSSRACRAALEGRL